VASRPTILVLTDFYLPGFRAGGPVRSIQNLVASLCNDFDFKVVTRDRDLGTDRPYAGVNQEWQAVEAASVRYLTPSQTRFSLLEILDSTHYDILYLNSFFSSRFSILPLLFRRLHAIPQRPLVIAPRGEFSPGALQLKSRKKRAWLSTSKMLGLCQDAIWQASSDGEMRDILSTIGGERSRIFVAPDITTPLPNQDSPSLRPAFRKIAGVAKMVFLSRISPKKNLEHALATLGQIPVGEIDFDIYGPVDDAAYWARCKRSMPSINGSVRVRYRGEIPHSQVHSVLSSYDLLVLPTLGENFGHVIYEAMAAGCPVAISDQTPWADVADAGAGWVTPLADEGGWIAALTHVVNADEDVQNGFREAARRLAEQHAYRQEDITMSRDMFIRSLA
jgi:glycosyltransferase involved in cell wall biosynthesis